MFCNQSDTNDLDFEFGPIFRNGWLWFSKGSSAPVDKEFGWKQQWNATGQHCLGHSSVSSISPIKSVVYNIISLPVSLAIQTSTYQALKKMKY